MSDGRPYGSLGDGRLLRRLENLERASKRDRVALLRNIDVSLKGAGALEILDRSSPGTAPRYNSA